MTLRIPCLPICTQSTCSCATSISYATGQSSNYSTCTTALQQVHSSVTLCTCTDGTLYCLLMLLHKHTRPLSLHAAVGQFKELVESSETDQPLQETLKKVLNFTSNGWHKAREHAMRAVSTDNRMRAWCADDSLEDGLLFKCYLGRVDLEAPVGECFDACSSLCLYA